MVTWVAPNHQSEVRFLVILLCRGRPDLRLEADMVGAGSTVGVPLRWKTGG